MLYLAYGMNTNRAAMADRCPNAKWLGGFYLPGYRLVFRGVADIVPDEGSVVPVVLWDITDDCLAALDRLEGYPNLYTRKIISGGWLAYMMVNKSREAAPGEHYYRMIEQGYRDAGLDDWHLIKAARDSAA